MEGEVVGGVVFLRPLRECLGTIADITRYLVLGHLARAHVLVQVGLLWQTLPARPRGLKLARPHYRSPLVVGHDGEEVASPNYLGSSNILDGAFVDAVELRAYGRRAHDARVHHPGDAEVVHVGECVGGLARNVEPLHRSSHDFEVLGVLGGNRLLRVERDGKAPAPDQVRVRHALAATGDDAVSDLEVFLLGAEASGSLLEQGCPGGCGRLADLDAADLDGEATPGRALLGRGCRVTLHDADACERDVELVRNNLGEGSPYPRTEIDLTGIERHRALGVDGKKRIHLSDGERLCRAGALCGGVLTVWQEREADDERAATLEHIATRGFDADSHRCLPQAMPAARLTALTMRAWVPHRQRLFASACLVSASLGFLFRARNAADSIIMPLMQ